MGGFKCWVIIKGLKTKNNEKKSNESFPSIKYKIIVIVVVVIIMIIITTTNNKNKKCYD